MGNISDKNDIVEQDLNDLIQLNAEESINLEFKSAGSLDFADQKKAEIAKDICAFANSAGGTIIYGINEINHKADSFSPIDGSLFTKEWLEQVIQSRVQRRINDLRIIPIRIGQNIKESAYVVKIPESPLAPHMTSDKRYYKRFNFESVQMEEYEIRNLYNRKEKTKLMINNIVIAGKPYDEDGVIFYELSFQVENIGHAVEKDYKLIIQLNFTEYTVKWDPLRHEKNFNHSLIDSNTRILSFSSTCPIFQNEILTIGHVTFGLPAEEMAQIIEREKFILKLLYTNGMDEMEISLKEVLKAPYSSDNVQNTY